MKIYMAYNWIHRAWIQIGFWRYIWLSINPWKYKTKAVKVI